MLWRMFRPDFFFVVKIQLFSFLSKPEHLESFKPRLSTAVIYEKDID